MSPAAPEPVWVRAAGADDDARMAARGLRRVRTVLQLRRPLPVPPGLRAGRPPLPVRPFRPDEDDDAWLAVNNRAFGWHPDQGGWDRDRLAARLAEPWVDLDGFLVHDGPDGLDGFCWTKVHAAEGDDGPLGEIFVIAADPAAQGTGLGRALVLAGLDHLTAAGLGTAVLWVESDNAPALALYDRLGFTVHHADAAYLPA